MGRKGRRRWETIEDVLDGVWVEVAEVSQDLGVGVVYVLMKGQIWWLTGAAREVDGIGAMRM